LLEGLVEPWGSRSDEGLVERDVGPVPIRSPPVDVAPRWNVPAPAGCCHSTSTIGFAKADPRVRGALGLLYPVALSRVG
jgi:hypothetical protein